MLIEVQFMPKQKKPTKATKPQTQPKPAPKTVDNPKKTSPLKFPGNTW